tara:strand:+ start:509 stop:685 length:177 start_codon:yes stop_codon:yes gene_type:complete
MTPIYFGETSVTRMHFGDTQDLQKAIFNAVEISGGLPAQMPPNTKEDKVDFTIFKKEK